MGGAEYVGAARDLLSYVNTLDATEALAEADHIARSIARIIDGVSADMRTAPAANTSLLFLAYALSLITRRYTSLTAVAWTPVDHQSLHACTLVERMLEAL